MKRTVFKRKNNKFGAIPIWIDNIRWPSQLQGGHYVELKLLLKGDIIRDLDWEVDFPLHVNGKLITTYRADFTFFHIGRNRKVILESKGKETELFNLKWKLAKVEYGQDYDFELVKKKSVYDIINAEN